MNKGLEHSSGYGEIAGRIIGKTNMLTAADKIELVKLLGGLMFAEGSADALREAEMYCGRLASAAKVAELGAGQ